jgi:hypothetical protein
MSFYEVRKLLFHVNREPGMFDRFLRERETLIAEHRLTEEEQRGILETNFRCLYEKDQANGQRPGEERK